MLAQAGWIYKTSGLEPIVLIGGSMTGATLSREEPEPDRLGGWSVPTPLFGLEYLEVVCRPYRSTGRIGIEFGTEDQNVPSAILPVLLEYGDAGTGGEVYEISMDVTDQNTKGVGCRKPTSGVSGCSMRRTSSPGSPRNLGYVVA
jgi:hypothetical protein